MGYKTAVLHAVRLVALYCCYQFITGSVFVDSFNDSGILVNNTRGCVSELRHISVTILENADIGSTVFSTGSASESSVSLVEGNEEGMFLLDGRNGTVVLAKYLDCEISSAYNLKLSVEEAVLHTGDTECYVPVYNLTIHVNDVIGWPHYFNKTCAWGTRKSDGFPAPLDAISKFGSWRNLYTPPNPSLPDCFLVPDLNNDDCDIILYVSRPQGFYAAHGLDCNSQFFIRKAHDPVWKNSNLFSGCFLRETSENVPDWIVKRLTAQGKIFDKFFVLVLPYHNYALAEENVVQIGLGEWMLEFQVKSLGCPPGKFGGLCDNDCVCENGATCHTFNGACKCQFGWKGVACDIAERSVVVTPKNTSGYFGEMIMLTCRAFHLSIGSVSDNQTGFSWHINDGEAVSSDTDDHVFVDEGISYSQIQVKNYMESYAGKYECRFRDQSGRVYSDVGYTNISGCPTNRWGNTCNQACDCVYASDCDRYSGCNCNEGWTGLHCDQVCQNGWFGKNCSQECLCRDEGALSCDVRAGQCECAHGFCGEHCEEQCLCDQWERAVCNNTGGCLCVQEFPRVEGDKVYVTLTVIAVCVLIAAVIVMTYMFFNRRKGIKYQHLGDEESEIMIIIQENLGDCKEWMMQRNDVEQTDTLLGQGQFGWVHKGRVKTARYRKAEEVAIKSVLPRRRNYQGHEQLIREIHCLIKLHGHQNIVSLRGFVFQTDVKFFVMEYAAMGDLLGHLRCLGNKISKCTHQQLLGYARQITLGMKRMEEKRIVHRDLASRNILLFQGDVAKISDFGLGRDVGESDGVYIKTPWAESHGGFPIKWMPPEFLTRGEFHIKSDVWSFGVLLWEIGTHGESPFKDITAYKFIREIARGERLAKPEACTDGAYKIMQKCWQSFLLMRPSAEQLTEEIDRLKNGEGLFIKEAVDCIPNTFDEIIL